MLIIVITVRFVMIREMMMMVIRMGMRVAEQMAMKMVTMSRRKTGILHFLFSFFYGERRRKNWMTFMSMMFIDDEDGDEG
jgi:hypothetical protein